MSGMHDLKITYCASTAFLIKSAIYNLCHIFHLAAEEKEPYEAKARQDKLRYKDEISGYKNPQPMNIDSGNESDSG